MISLSELVLTKKEQLEIYKKLKKWLIKIKFDSKKAGIMWSLPISIDFDTLYVSSDDLFKKLLSYKFDFTNENTYEFIISKYLCLHLILMNQFSDIYLEYNEVIIDEKIFSQIQYESVNEYILFINSHKDLEQIFGTTIENDMIMIYEAFGYKK